LKTLGKSTDEAVNCPPIVHHRVRNVRCQTWTTDQPARNGRIYSVEVIAVALGAALGGSSPSDSGIGR